jgi:hypothetical protein
MYHTEHFVPRSHDPSRSHDYENTLYVCSFCNLSRGDDPVVGESGERLLNPCEEQWERHFEIVDHELRAKQADGDAEYTADRYRIGDRAKTMARRMRYENLNRLRDILRHVQAMFESLSTGDRRKQDVVRMQAAFAHLTAISNNAKELLREWDLKPADAPPRCRCTTSPGLPRHLLASLTA